MIRFVMKCHICDKDTENGLLDKGVFWCKKCLNSIKPMTKKDKREFRVKIKKALGSMKKKNR